MVTTKSRAQVEGSGTGLKKGRKLNDPMSLALKVVGSKWTVLIVNELSAGTRRFSELERALEGISPRTLSMRLGGLQDDGVLERKVFAEVPPRVEYKLTTLGKALEPVLEAMRKFGEKLG